MSIEILTRCDFCNKEVFISPKEGEKKVVTTDGVNGALPMGWRTIVQNNSYGKRTSAHIFCSQRCVGAWYIRDAEAAEADRAKV